MKHLSPDEIAAFPHKNVIVRALGMKETVQVDVHVDAPRARRPLPPLLRRPVGHGRRTRRSRRSSTSDDDLDAVCEKLIATANKNGGLDNITVVVARVEQA